MPKSRLRINDDAGFDMAINAMGDDAVNSSNSADSLTPDPSGQGVQITVTLQQRSLDDLDRVCESTGYSKTDAINRAIQIYALLEENSADGSQIIIRRPRGSTELIKFLS